MKDPIEDAGRYLARADASPAGRAHVRKVLEDRDAWCQAAMDATRERNEARAEVERLRTKCDEALALAERRRITLEMEQTIQEQLPEGIASLRAEIQRLRGAILAALDNLENGPEGALMAEGALRLALNAD